MSEDRVISFPKSSGLAVEQREGVRLLRMEFGSANALNPTVLDALATGISGEEPRPTVLTGEGSVFCAGLDLMTLDTIGRDDFEEFVTRFSATMIQLLTTPFPLVAAVNGHAVAGGCVLALACDYRIGTAGEFKIGMNELAIGLTLPAVAMEIPRGALEPQALRRVVLGAELMDPDAALGLGILDELADDADAAVDRACDVARELGRSPEAFAAVKGQVVAPVANAIRDRREAMDRRFVDTWFSDATKETRRKAIERLTKKS